MRTKTLILTVFLMLTSLKTFSQSNYYYYKGVRKELTIDRKHVNVILKTDFAKSSISNLSTKDFEIKDTDNPNEKWATIEFDTELSEMEYLQKVNALKNNPSVECVATHYKNGATKTVGTSNLFYIKLKTATDEGYLRQFAVEKNAIVVGKNEFMPLWFELKTSRNSLTSVALTNQFFETGRFEAIDPMFILESRFDPTPPTSPIVAVDTENTLIGCSNDPSYIDQLGLKNIKACRAWNLGAAGNGIKIAVLDSGIQLNHTDLAANISPLSYDTDTSDLDPLNPISYPSVVYRPHGTHVAGIIGAVRNNGIHVAGVAPNAKLISVSTSLSPSATNQGQKLANGIGWAVANGADIINNSWGYSDMIGSGFTIPILESAISNALNHGRNGLGTIIVFASGNGFGDINYPAAFDDRNLVVGAMAANFNYAVWSNFGDKLDLAGPGVNILSTFPTNAIGYDSGTSMAAPHVAGVAALVLSVNPCLNGQQLRDILEYTTIKYEAPVHNNIPSPNVYDTVPERPNGTWNWEVGYGLVNAFGSTQLAQQMHSATLDLYIKDNYTDFGLQPNPSAGILSNSPDIWIRNIDDNIDEDQPAVVKNTPNYVYVRVRNKSCVSSQTTDPEGSTNEVVNLYMSRPSASAGDENPTSRMNPLSNDNYILVGSRTVPQLAVGGEVILKFPWTAPISWVPAGGHLVNVNLLAKIISPNDPMAVPETASTYNNIIKNNNIAGKNNIAINYDYLSDNGGHFPEKVVVSNPFDDVRSFKLELVKEDTETGKPIYDEAEVGVKMDEVLYAAWTRGGKVEQNLAETVDVKKQIVEDNHVLIDNIVLNAHEQGSVELNFSFLAKEITNKANFKYHIIQRELTTNEIVGVVTFNIYKKPRPSFVADADDKEKDRNETITISAKQISEPAVYNWYDAEGNLIFVGKDLTVATDVAKKYKLEVIATADGFKDYTEVEVKLKPSVLSVIAPNPATDNVTIGYKINEGGSAYLMILGGYGTNSASNNYIINPELGEININLANYGSGFYTVALVVNGHIIDAKTLAKE
jgi:serine protease